jgi:hypothetical protein
MGGSSEPPEPPLPTPMTVNTNSSALLSFSRLFSCTDQDGLTALVSRKERLSHILKDIKFLYKRTNYFPSYREMSGDFLQGILFGNCLGINELHRERADFMSEKQYSLVECLFRPLQ